MDSFITKSFVKVAPANDGEDVVAIDCGNDNVKLPLAAAVPPFTKTWFAVPVTVNVPVFVTDVPETLMPVPAVTTVISALPLNETPCIFLAVCNVVAVPALPDMLPNTFEPVTNDAVLAVPCNDPVNAVDETEVKPANDVDVPPKDVEVEPIVIAELTNAPFGMLVNEAPLPVKPTAVIFVVTFNDPVTSVFVKCLIVVPSSLVFESIIWNGLPILGSLFCVNAVSFPKLFDVSGPVIKTDDVIAAPLWN